jgi:hypothetical protein
VYATLGLLQAVGIGVAAIVVLIVALFVVAVIVSAIKVVKEYERGVIFRLGRVQGGPKGPGLFDLRTRQRHPFRDYSESTSEDRGQHLDSI